MLSCDSDTDIEEEFFTALALFKSSKRNSEVKLREMLLTSIAKKQKFSNHDRRIPYPVSTNKNITELSGQIPHSYIEENFKDSKMNFNNNTSSEDNPLNILEIPTISIPDEEFNDFITCKICDGTKIGPFILLECQDCSDTYHPLCHQPPVTDIDVYDPRLVWRCNNCAGLCKKISSYSNENKNRNIDQEIKNINENISEIKSKNHNEKRDIIKEIVSKEEYSSLGNHFRKRIGSKLTVSRVNSKS